MKSSDFKNIKKIVSTNIPFICLIFLFWILYSYISIIKHQHYQTLTWDTGFFDQLIWKLSRFKNPVSSFSGLQVFGDHFQLVLLFLVPLYWLPFSLSFLFIAQALIAVFSAVPIYLLSLKFLKNKFLSLSICISFLLFVPLQFAILDGFHQSVFSVPFYSFALYALFSKKHNLYWLSIIGLLITKEEMALLAAAIGVVVFIWGEKHKGVVTILLSLMGFFIAVNIILPLVQGYYPHYGYGELGNTPAEVITSSLKHPSLFIRNLFYPQPKIETVFQSFLSFGFLPIFSPTLLIPALQQFIVRFLDTVTIHRWTSLNHYSFPIAPTMAVAAILSAEKLIKRFNIKIGLISIYILGFALLQDYFYHGPINNLLKNDFYLKKQWIRDNDKILSYLPKNASVAATNNFGPHVSQRDQLYLIGKENISDFLLFDLENSSFKYTPQNHQTILDIFNGEINRGRYEIYKNFGQAYLLKRKQQK